MPPAQVIEFLLILLIAASIVAIIASRFRIPYTIALVLGGFGINFFHIPIQTFLGQRQGASTHFLTPDVVFILFLPALLFEAGINLNLRQLRANVTPILFLAIFGVITAMIITGYTVHWVLGLPLLSALIFGALISATDPVSVLALFKNLGVSKRLSILIEGESLFNDGTAIVLFQILLAAVATGGINVVDGIRQFIVVSAGGAVLGLVLGYAASRITQQIDDPRIEITLTTILAYSAYLIAEHLHISGVIATVMAGLMVGNYGAEIGMSPRTRVALWSFWEYVSFVVNSLVFLLIGVEVRFGDLIGGWKAVMLALALVLIGRAVSVYALLPAAGLFSEKVPLRWQHILVWGGLHGGVSIALALSLKPDIPGRHLILAMTFGVVAFSIVVQGLTIPPLLRLLGIQAWRENEYDKWRVRALAINAARQELETMASGNLLNDSVYGKLQEELEARSKTARDQIQELAAQRPEMIDDELRMARTRLLTAEKSAIRQSANNGLVSNATAESLLTAADEKLENLRHGVG